MTLTKNWKNRRRRRKERRMKRLSLNGQDSHQTTSRKEVALLRMIGQKIKPMQYVSELLTISTIKFDLFSYVCPPASTKAPEQHRSGC